MDMRELRSKLPSLLDMAGVEIVPVTLEVGDYVISPDIVIERKSVPDLIGSLNSGRLYNQAEAMARHYKTPALLVEFDQDRPFALADNTELPTEIDARDVRSKLVLLLLHFPSLRLIWSRSPHVTVRLFKELKKGRPEPDRETAALVGTETEGGGAGGKEGEGDAATRNLAAIDLLRKLPGVTVGNYKAIMAAVPTLAALAVTPQAELSKVIGKPNAALLYEFLHNRKAAALL
jgi:DNA excision repair protein ERCC-4